MSLRQRILEEKRRLIYPVVTVLLLNVGLYLAVDLPAVDEGDRERAVGAGGAGRRERRPARLSRRRATR